MKRKFIFGCSTLAQSLFYHLKNDGYTTVAFVVDDNYCDQDQFCGIPLVPYSKMEKLLPATEHEAYIAIGYTDMNAVRKEVMERLFALGYSLPNYIHHSVICENVTMGKGNLFFPGLILDLDVQIADGNIFFPGSLISHDAKIGNYNFFAPRTVLAGNVVIENQNFLGLNCSVKNGTRIGNSCFIGASAYVAQDLKDRSVIVPPRSTLLKKDCYDVMRDWQQSSN